MPGPRLPTDIAGQRQPLGVDGFGRPQRLSTTNRHPWPNDKDVHILSHSWRRWQLANLDPTSLPNNRLSSFPASVRNWLYLHNESINIHSHLIPAVLFRLVEAYIQAYLAARYPDVTAADHAVVGLFSADGDGVFGAVGVSYGA